MDDLNTGVEAPDSLASAGTLPQDSGNISDESTAVAAEAVQDADPGTPGPAADEEDISQYLEEAPTDTDLVKKLRGLVKTKYDDYAARFARENSAQQQPDTSQEAQELINELYGFDTEAGRPTTRGFAQKLAQKDIGLAEQAFVDLANIPVPDSEIEGYTLAHKFLEQIGLDPFKIEDLRAFSRGEHPMAQAVQAAAAPEYVPGEYSEAYSQLSEVLRKDIDIYLDMGTPEQKAAALQLLQDKQAVINNSRANEAYQRQQAQQFEANVAQTIDQQVTETYEGLLSAVKLNPAYKEVKVNADPNVDSAIKDTLIAQINALGDPRSLLAKNAVSVFKSLGVDVDMGSVETLLRSIEAETAIAVRAEQLGKLQNRDYSVHVREALGRRSQAVAKTVALANNYFSRALAAVSGNRSPAAAPAGGMPMITGGPPTGGNGQQKAMSVSDLDRFALETARRLQQ